MSEARANQVPGMPHAICHACGLGQKCANSECPNTSARETWSFLGQALRRSVTAVPRNEWKPINTAPRDETAVLLWGKLHGQTVAWWQEDSPTVSGWATFEGNIYHPSVFTYWQPLQPDPPT